MFSLPSLRRSKPSINQFSSIRRLQFRQFHSSLTASGFDSNKHEDPSFGSFLKWFSGIVFGSGLLSWSCSLSDSNFFFFFNNNNSLLAFADSSTACSEVEVRDPRSFSLFPKLSLHDNTSWFLFGGKC